MRWLFHSNTSSENYRIHQYSCCQSNPQNELRTRELENTHRSHRSRARFVGGSAGKGMFKPVKGIERSVVNATPSFECRSPAAEKKAECRGWTGPLPSQLVGKEGRKDAVASKPNRRRESREGGSAGTTVAAQFGYQLSCGTVPDPPAEQVFRHPGAGASARRQRGNPWIQTLDSVTTGQ